MSGTSLDGLDLVYVSFEKNINFVFNILAAKTYSYSDIWVHKLKRAFNKNLNELSELDLEYGESLGNLINLQNE